MSEVTGPFDEVLLGFDARVVPAEAGALWDLKRRARFLLKSDAASPLSVDVMVWPSLFDWGQGAGMTPFERGRLRLAGLAPPVWTGANAGLWDDLDAMRAYLHERGGEGALPRHTVVAITWVMDPASMARRRAGGPYARPTTPAAIAPAWTRLGYDVADASRLSGLANCGYEAREAEPLRERWTRFLNVHHVFDQIAYALAFRQAADIRVPEHAPFFVYGLYVIEDAKLEQRGS
jgi:hypothetical protein